MSTRAIREALYYLRGIDYDRETLDAALAEVEAIERAAGAFRELKEIGQCSAEDAAHMDKTFIGIAKESAS